MTRPSRPGDGPATAPVGATADARILGALRAAGDRGSSGAELAVKAGLSLEGLSSHLAGLIRLGYQIEMGPHRGYRLLRTPDALHADDLHSRLGKTEVIGRDIRVFQETTSTNDVVDKLARDQVKEGAVVFAETQTRGRGRLGRRWVSPPALGLWFSILLRPALPPESATQLTIAAATAVSRAIRLHSDLRPEIKWPNDLLIRGRKVAGVLTELSAELDRTKYVILGIGVDVNQKANDFPPELRSTATSLRVECGHQVDRPALAAAILRELDFDYARVLQGQFEAVADEWESHCTTLGHEVCIQTGDRKVRGRAESLDPTGALLLRTHHGHLERITGGDVTLGRSNDSSF
jgi:BirA family transcriptional regulator, biotin operon repressor / biotin---[acetyl-CoA-carboxylase] ligase